MIEKSEDLQEDLQSNELFKRDVKNTLSYVTPYIPLIGLACGAICLGKHIMRNKKPRDEQSERSPQSEE